MAWNLKISDHSDKIVYLSIYKYKYGYIYIYIYIYYHEFTGTNLDIVLLLYVWRIYDLKEYYNEQNIFSKWSTKRISST